MQVCTHVHVHTVAVCLSPCTIHNVHNAYKDPYAVSTTRLAGTTPWAWHAPPRTSLYTLRVSRWHLTAPPPAALNVPSGAECPQCSPTPEQHVQCYYMYLHISYNTHTCTHAHTQRCNVCEVIHIHWLTSALSASILFLLLFTFPESSWMIWHFLVFSASDLAWHRV